MTETAVLLNAETVAVIGASPDQHKIGGKPTHFLEKFDFQGRVVPINPKYQKISKWRCYPDLASYEGKIDVAVIAVPFQYAQAVLEDCVRHKVRQVVMFSSGYAETDDDGVERQTALENCIAGSGTRLLGPNAVGLANLQSGMITNFSQSFDLPLGTLKSGSLAFASQSGAFGTLIFTMASEQGIGFKYFAATGNEADITISDLIAAFVQDADVKCIAGYVEGVRDGRKFLAACEAARQAKKPLILIKTARTESGSIAALSHTAAMAGAEGVYEAAFRQTGVIRVDDEEEMLDILALLQAEKAIKGNRVGVLTMSGGAGVMLADAIDASDLELSELDASTITKLKYIVPVFGSTNNPVDLTGQFLNKPEMLVGALDCMLADRNVDSVILFLGLGRTHGSQIAKVISSAAISSKPLVVAWTAGPKAVIKELQEQGVPVFSSPARAVGALSALRRLDVAQKFNSRSFSLPLTAEVRSLSDMSGQCSEATTKAYLEKYGVQLLPELLATSEDDAVVGATSLGYPLVLKVCSPDLPHKTEAGAVILNISNEVELREAYRTAIANARQYSRNLCIEGVLISPMADDGIELIVGARRDPVFGPLIMVGAGGIYAEVLRDNAIALVPLVEGEALGLIQSLRIAKLLGGVRGKSAADIDSVLVCIHAIERLMLEHPEIEEIEINPLRVFVEGKGAMPLDAYMVLSEQAQEVISLDAATYA